MEERRVSFSSYTFQGPTPPPETLRQYAEIYPDAPRIIFQSFEEQGKHRRMLESRQHYHSIVRGYLGLGAGTIICGSVIALGGVAIAYGQGLAAAAAFVTAITGLAAVFVIGQSQQKKERIERAKIMAGKK